MHASSLSLQALIGCFMRSSRMLGPSAQSKVRIRISPGSAKSSPQSPFQVCASIVIVLACRSPMQVAASGQLLALCAGTLRFVIDFSILVIQTCLVHTVLSSCHAVSTACMDPQIIQDSSAASEDILISRLRVNISVKVSLNRAGGGSTTSGKTSSICWTHAARLGLMGGFR